MVRCSLSCSRVIRGDWENPWKNLGLGENNGVAYDGN